MVDALETTLPRAQKIVGIFMLGMACGQIPAGLFSDRLGRMPVLYAGMLLFAVRLAVLFVHDLRMALRGDDGGVGGASPEQEGV